MKKYIPSIITAGSILCGVLAVQLGDFYWSSILIICSVVLDTFDGLTARLLNATSEFGKQMDSFADIISFGMAPAYMYFLMAPDDSFICTIVPSIMVLAGVIRLIIFNLSPSRPYFKGLPIPSNALFFLGVILGYHNENQFIIDFFNVKFYYVATALIMSALMLAFPLRMFSLKGFSRTDHKANIYLYALVAISLILLGLFSYPAIPLMVLTYVLLSIIYTLNTKVDPVLDQMPKIM